MNWDKLLAFYHAATLGSGKKAADKMDVSTATISRLISGLEKEIGHELFNVVAQRMILTKKGEKFLVSVKRLLAKYDVSLRELAEMSQKMEGYFTISGTISIIALWLFDDMAEFMKTYPEISFAFKGLDYIPDLTIGEADIDVRPLAQKDEEVEYEYLTTHDIGLYASKDYIQKAGIPERISDFERHNLFSFSSSFLVDYTTLNWHLTHINSWKKLITVSSYMGILKGVENGLGIGPVSHAAVKMSRVPLVPILPDILTHPMDIYYSYPKKLADNKVINELYDYLRERPEGPLKGRIRM